MIMTMVEGQIYTWKHPSYVTTAATINVSTYSFSTTQYAIAVYGSYASASDTLTAVGFTYYDSAMAPGCACTDATINGLPQIVNTAVGVSKTIAVYAITSDITDTVSNVIGIT